LAFDLIHSYISALPYKNAFLLWPKQWEKYQHLHNLIWNYIPYRQESLTTLPNEPGVYAFVIRPEIANLHDCGYLMYVGKAEKQSLRMRCRTYFAESKKKKGRPPIHRLLTFWKSNLYLYFATVPSDGTLVSDVEAELLKAFVPPCNTQFPGKLGRVAKLVYGP